MFLRLLLLAAALPAAGLYLFVVLVDPWGMLPVHLPIGRVPISTNARFSFPALAVSARFDAAVFGTSTSRLLRPAVLDPTFGRGVRFANLAMNAATAWEQGELIKLFARHHPDAKAVVIGLDSSWCLADADAPHLTGRPFPAWMYGGTRWRGYLAMFDLYALQEAANQFAVATGLHRAHYGTDGYTNFLPPDGAYDRARVEATFRRWGAVDDAPATGAAVQLPYVDDLPSLLGRLPRGATKLLFFPPITLETMGRPGSAVRASWDACKARTAAAVRRMPGALLVDFAIDDAVTRDHGQFWDPLHYRVGIADAVMADMALALDGRPSPDGLDRILARGPAA